MNKVSALPADFDCLIDFASQIHAKRHPYVVKKEDLSFDLTSHDKAIRLSDLHELIERCLYCVQNQSGNAASCALDLALARIERYLASKLRWNCLPFCKRRHPVTQQLLARVRGYRSLLDAGTGASGCEALARLDFLARQRGPAASPAELKALRLLSRMVWRLVDGDRNKYVDTMRKVLAGAPLLAPLQTKAASFGDFAAVPHQTVPIGRPTSKRKASYRRMITGPLTGALCFGRMYSKQHEDTVMWVCRTAPPKEAKLRQILWAQVRKTLGGGKKLPPIAIFDDR
ncbi:MAG: hypothetical protein KDK78_08595 [Chlamydiia bacterium]|nr:hypothetical protein [Chlamydiia bacterium]